jgi:diguanylate cyclase (GGDEF)-like protein
MSDLTGALEGIRKNDPRALILFDLDGFKHYNDTFGHPAGDLLLARLGASVGAFVATRGGAAYRIGGDEFCILSTRVHDESLVSEAAFALTERGEGFSVGCSFGSIVVPDEAADADEALRTVDQRMYAHKQNGRISAGRQTKDVLRRALIERDPQLDDHSGDVAALAGAVAQRMGMRDGEIESVRLAAELCNIGTVAVPDSILRKPAALDETDMDFVRRHPIDGERILAVAPALACVAKLVRSSHERVDGGGYPDGLSGDEIPLGARIVFACDSYATMLAERSHADRGSEADAITELRYCAGTQFDPAVVEALCAVLEPVNLPGSAGPSPA